MTQERKCNNPAPSGGGLDCVGDSVMTHVCKNINCLGKCVSSNKNMTSICIMKFIICIDLNELTNKTEHLEQGENKLNVKMLKSIYIPRQNVLDAR